MKDNSKVIWSKAYNESNAFKRRANGFFVKVLEGGSDAIADNLSVSGKQQTGSKEIAAGRLLTLIEFETRSFHSS